uniref:Exodeoxyribonuclease 7 large subunit n=1 Tax=Acidobacterium capsulatum TaxID=33075 RepID=A0A7V5CSS2_9BACT
MGFFFEAPVAREDTPRIWKIGELVAEARAHIERRFAELRVEGEISNLRAAPSGHLYFTLKDGEAQLPAVFFRRQASLLRFRPQDGMQVLLRGRLTIYEQRGQMQMVGETMEPLGAGSLQVAFEQLKAKLKARGLFEAERKRPLPAYPRCVGIVTSPTGAVIRDFLNIVQRRHAALQVLLYPATVQGEGAAAEVAAGIAYFNRTREVDAIVIARGGGSLEDLAPFNTELLAEAIAASELPVVSAVGHETDFTIADFVADLRAPTPSAAAELITAAQHRVEEDLSALSQRLERAMRFRMMQARHGFDRVRVEQMTVRMMDALHRRQQKLDELGTSAELAIRGRLQQKRERLLHAQNALARQDVVHRLHPMRERLERQCSALERAAQHYLSHRQERLHGLEGKLRALSPMGVLERGYALVFDRQGRLVKSVDSLKSNEEMTTRLADGNVTSTIRHLNKA